MILLLKFLIGYSVLLQWDKESDPVVAGYKLYEGSISGNYFTNFDVNNQTQYTVNNLEFGETYYFAATAYTLAGIESIYSNEVSVYKPIVLTIKPGEIDAEVSIGKTYVLQESEDLLTWTDYSSLIAATNSVSFAIDTSKAMDFFRLQKNAESSGQISQRQMIREAIVSSSVPAPKLSLMTRILRSLKYKSGRHFDERRGAEMLMIHPKPTPPNLPPMPPVMR